MSFSHNKDVINTSCVCLGGVNSIKSVMSGDHSTEIFSNRGSSQVVTLLFVS